MDPQVDILARTLWGEARGEGFTGQQAVANVVMNRVDISTGHSHFGDGTVSGACLAPWQFSCHNPNDPNCQVLQQVTVADSIFAQCVQISELAISGELPDITGGATYYYAKGSPAPPWAVGKEPCATIGHHLFFRSIL